MSQKRTRDNEALRALHREQNKRFYNQETKEGKEGETEDESDSEDESETNSDDDNEDLKDIVGSMEQPEAEKKKWKRGPTRMESLWKGHDANNKINLKFNRFGQPCGLKTCKLTNFIGTLVKGKEISLAAKNWSKVAKADKEKLWLTVQAFFNVDESFKPWVLRSASKKWKDLKVVLKRTFFNPNITRRQNIRNGCGQRIPDQQGEWLVRYWKTSAAQDRSEKNKAIHAMQLNGAHTTGSKSFAVTLDQLETKEGRQVGRAELYIVTHAKKNGEPVDKYSGDNIKEIKSQLAANPSLIGEEAHDGDVFSGLFPKERSGRWRGLGLLVGGRASKELAEVKAELQETKNENMRLWSVINALQKNQSALQEQHNELKTMLLASQERVPAQSDQKIVQEPKDPPVDNQDKETPVSPRDSKISKVKAEFVEKMTMSTQQTSKDYPVDNQDKETPISDSKISKVKAESVEKKTKITQQASKKGQPTQQMEKAPNLQQKRKAILSDKDMHKKPRKFQTPLQKGGLAVLKRGLEVGLISPQSTSMVAFATIQAADRKSKATDGQTLNDCVEVLVNTVFSKTTLLPHSQGNISKLAAAVGRCVRWPRKNLEPLPDGSGDRQPPKEPEHMSSVKLDKA